MPGVISSISLIVIGAVTRYAYSDSVWRWHSGGQTHSLQLDTVGLILLWAGVVGLLLSIALSFMVPRYYEDDYPGHHVDEDYDEVVDYRPGEKPVKIIRRHRRH